MVIRALLFPLLILPLAIYSQELGDTAAIIRELEVVRDRDQKPRKNGESYSVVRANDSLNLAWVERLIGKYGWPGKSFVRTWGNNTVFLVIQHADLAVQQKYLPLLVQSVADSQSRPCDLALLQDRVLMRTDKKQIYGSQVVRNSKTGNWEFYPIDDEKNVNIRRSQAGLGPIEDYAKSFGINYLPTEK